MSFGAVAANLTVAKDRVIARQVARRTVRLRVCLADEAVVAAAIQRRPRVHIP